MVSAQTQINEKTGMTFASGLRNVLRQDPDIIMIGEIRDRETAEMAIQSALTGHMVYSTLHTNDAPSAVTRLLDLGIEPYLVASSVVGVLAQRLIRKICSHCVQELPVAAPEHAEFLALGIPENEVRVFRGRGCPQCRDTGYQGRVGIFEMMPIVEPIRRLIQQQGNASDVRVGGCGGRNAAAPGKRATKSYPRNDNAGRSRSYLDGWSRIDSHRNVNH